MNIHYNLFCFFMVLKRAVTKQKQITKHNMNTNLMSLSLKCTVNEKFVDVHETLRHEHHRKFHSSTFRTEMGSYAVNKIQNQ